MAEAPGLKVVLHQASPIPLDLSLTCGDNEMLAILGPSGSGKTTILRCIAGLVTAREGHIGCGGEAWFDSKNSINKPTHLRRVGLVFQHYALFPHMTALDNVKTALGQLPRHERRARAEALLAAVHLDGLAKRRPAELSGGQQQRVAIARALARDPAVLLLDEPFSAIDRPTRRKLHEEIVSLRESLRIPIVLVTHDIDDAQALATQIAVLDRGRILQSGTLGELRRKPVSGRVAEIIDSPPLG